VSEARKHATTMTKTIAAAVAALAISFAHLPASNANEFNESITVGQQPNQIVISPDGSTLYVSNTTSSTVSVISTSTASVLKTIQVGFGPRGMAISPDGTRVYVASYISESISVISTATQQIITTFTAQGSPHKLAVSANGSKLYVSRGIPSSLRVVDASSGLTEATIPMPGDVRGMALSPSGKALYVITERCSNYPCPPGELTVIDTDTGGVKQTVTVGINPQDVSVSPNGTNVYVSDLNDLLVIDAELNGPAQTFRRAGGGAISYSPDGLWLYSANFFSAKVLLIETATNQIQSSISVPRRPVDLLVSPDSERLFVLSQVDGPVRDPNPGVVSIFRVTPPPPTKPSMTITCKRVNVNLQPHVRCRGVTTGIPADARLNAFTRAFDKNRWEKVTPSNRPTVTPKASFVWTIPAPSTKAIDIYFSYLRTKSNTQTVKLGRR